MRFFRGARGKWYSTCSWNQKLINKYNGCFQQHMSVMDPSADPKWNSKVEKALRLIPPSTLADLLSASTEKRDRALRRAAEIISQGICDPALR